MANQIKSYGGAFQKHDSYMTPKYAWENIKHLIPKDSVIWEPFYGDGTSGIFFEELGFNVIHRNEDFFDNNHGDIIVSNPPYSMKKRVFEKLKELDKPFIMLVPMATLNSKYFRELFADQIQIIVPKKRIHFLKEVDGVVDPNQKNGCPFDTWYFCYKMNLERDLTWLK